jgi:hypothetical protein
MQRAGRGVGWRPGGAQQEREQQDAGYGNRDFPSSLPEAIAKLRIVMSLFRISMPVKIRNGRPSPDRHTRPEPKAGIQTP